MPDINVDELLERLEDCCHRAGGDFRGELTFSTHGPNGLAEPFVPPKVRVARTNLLEIVGQLRDCLSAVASGDREVLLEMFGGDCSRIARIRAMLDCCLWCAVMKESQETVLKDVHTVKGCKCACLTVEAVLVEKGFSSVLDTEFVKQQAAFAQRSAIQGPSAEENEKLGNVFKVHGHGTMAFDSPLRMQRLGSLSGKRLSAPSLLETPPRKQSISEVSGISEQDTPRADEKLKEELKSCQERKEATEEQLASVQQERQDLQAAVASLHVKEEAATQGRAAAEQGLSSMRQHLCSAEDALAKELASQEELRCELSILKVGKEAACRGRDEARAQQEELHRQLAVAEDELAQARSSENRIAGLVRCKGQEAEQTAEEVSQLQRKLQEAASRNEEMSAAQSRIGIELSARQEEACQARLAAEREAAARTQTQEDLLGQQRKLLAAYERLDEQQADRNALEARLNDSSETIVSLEAALARSSEKCLEEQAALSRSEEEVEAAEEAQRDRERQAEIAEAAAAALSSRRMSGSDGALTPCSLASTTLFKSPSQGYCRGPPPRSAAAPAVLHLAAPQRDRSRGLTGTKRAATLDGSNSASLAAVAFAAARAANPSAWLGRRDSAPLLQVPPPALPLSSRRSRTSSAEAAKPTARQQQPAATGKSAPLELPLEDRSSRSRPEIEMSNACSSARVPATAIDSSKQESTQTPRIGVLRVTQQRRQEQASGQLAAAGDRASKAAAAPAAAAAAAAALPSSRSAGHQNGQTAQPQPAQPALAVGSKAPEADHYRSWPLGASLKANSGRQAAAAADNPMLDPTASPARRLKAAAPTAQLPKRVLPHANSEGNISYPSAPDAGSGRQGSAEEERGRSTSAAGLKKQAAPRGLSRTDSQVTGDRAVVQAIRAERARELRQVDRSPSALAW
eukprot:TRINITY_DN50726_c1_g1_i1.p1 TRINITY_DN50726_c1_g1~~TRINITY_DN50726_c1_g1_i1.p1  ORF type:complete len:916 (+),score=289.56 TRINITY_DN50726_c1_g1_i1:83-2830(+)